MTDVAYGTVTAVALTLASVAMAACFGVDCARGRGWLATMGAPAVVALPALLGQVVGEAGKVRVAGRPRR